LSLDKGRCEGNRVSLLRCGVDGSESVSQPSNHLLRDDQLPSRLIGDYLSLIPPALYRHVLKLAMV
jgi:hypothetical protein